MCIRDSNVTNLNVYLDDNARVFNIKTPATEQTMYIDFTDKPIVFKDKIDHEIPAIGGGWSGNITIQGYIDG